MSQDLQAIDICMNCKRKMSREKIYFRVEKGSLVPVDQCASRMLRERNYKVGNIVLCDITKPRNPKFNRLVHRIGQLVVANIDSFAGFDSHKAIKRIQIEGKVACDEIGIMVPGYGMLIQFIPRSISFANMDEAEFHEAARGLCRTIAERYWPDLSPEKIEEMAESFVNE